MEKINNITPFKKDAIKWYSDLVLQSGLISYGPVKGTMFFKPYGFSIWSNIQNKLNKEFNKFEIEEVRFPLLFPESFLEKEKDHISGFKPEVLKVTKVGEKDLLEPLIIRPTSETLFGLFFSENILTYSQLPVKLNQWVNVMRWENNTRPFLRNSEFFWQEGHTVHRTANEACLFAKKIHTLYKNFLNKILLLPVLTGEKTIKERFAGANNTYTIESVLKDGQFLQSGTSHFLGHKFSKAFNIKVQGQDNNFFHPYQTSWGVSTRLIGALIMTHSDDKGLILPSKIAPIQVIIMTLFGDKEPKVIEEANNLKSKLKNFKVKVDPSSKRIGFKSHEWELKGVPIRIEIGPKDLKNKKVILSIRNSDKKIEFNLNEINNKLIKDILENYDKLIYKNAIKIKESKKVEFDSIEEIPSIIDSGKYGIAYWNEDIKSEKKIKDIYGVSIRCLFKVKEEGISINDSKPTKTKAIFARAY